MHSDHSILYRYFNAPSARGVSRAAFSINNHLGLERGGLSTATGSFLGTAIANRVWFSGDRAALTVRGEVVDNPSRYLAILPTPAGFPDSGTTLHLTGLTVTFDVLPTDIVAWRFEYLGRKSNVPYWAGESGLVRAQHLAVAAINFRM